jgi:hypothetical protein
MALDLVLSIQWYVFGLKATHSVCQSTFNACKNIFTSGWGYYSGWLNITSGEIFDMDSGCVKALLAG